MATHNGLALLLNNAGTHQFKPIFVGQGWPQPPNHQDEVSGEPQTCIRTSGDRNVLEDAGNDNYHYTVPEILGHW